MRMLVSISFIVGCYSATDPTLLQQGVEVGNSATAGWINNSTRSCYTLTQPIMPGKMFSFQMCTQHGYSFLAGSASGKTGLTVGGRLDFPCASFSCAPTGGTINIEYQIWPKVKSENSGDADDDHGEKNSGFVDLSGHVGIMVSIAGGQVAGGANIAITIYGSAQISVFEGLASGRGTISGILTFYNFKLSINPFHMEWSKVDFKIEIRISVRIGYAEFQFALDMLVGGGWHVSISLGNFFGIGDCYQNSWVRRRHWCEHHPRRRNSVMNQYCWGPGSWNTCGEFGSVPYPGCRLLGVNPMCLNDNRRRRRRRRTRRRRKLNDGTGCDGVWHGHCNSGKCAVREQARRRDRDCCSQTESGWGNDWCKPPRRRRDRRRRDRRRRDRRRRDRRRRDRRRRTRRRRKLNNNSDCSGIWHGHCNSGKCAMQADRRRYWRCCSQTEWGWGNDWCKDRRRR